MKAQLIAHSTVRCRPGSSKDNRWLPQPAPTAAEPDRKQLQRPARHPTPSPASAQRSLLSRPHSGKACKNRWDTRSSPWLSVMSPAEAFGDAVWVVKTSKEHEGGGARRGFSFLGEIRVARRPGRLENRLLGDGRGHAGYRSGPAYVSVLFLCGLRELYICWAHKKSMWLHVL